MSAINTLTFQNVIVFPHSHRACARACARTEDTIQQNRRPVVTARWMLETGHDGSRRLVRQWFTSDRQTEGAGNHRQG